jgi:hypothetical protein
MSKLELREKQQHVVEFVTSNGGLTDETMIGNEVGLPDWFMRNSNVVKIASEKFLSGAGHIPGVMSDGWQPHGTDVFWKPVGSWVTLRVRKCDELWVIERERLHKEVLFFIGSAALCARNKEGAMRLAEFCNWLPKGFQDLGWRDLN